MIFCVQASMYNLSNFELRPSNPAALPAAFLLLQAESVIDRQAISMKVLRM
jgi:hypothetical protein